MISVGLSKGGSSLSAVRSALGKQVHMDGDSEDEKKPSNASLCFLTVDKQASEQPVRKQLTSKTVDARHRLQI